MAGKGVFDYDRLKDTMDSVLRDRSRKAQKDRPWVIRNMLPTEFELYHNPQYSDKTFPLGSIRPQNQRVFPPQKFFDGDQLFVMYRRKSGTKSEQAKLHLAMPPHTFQSQWKNVKLGDVLYRSWDGGRQYFTSYADLSGLLLHNHLMFPLNVFFKGNLIGQMGAYDGLTYLGGSDAVLYVDNDRAGFRLGDQLTFGYSMPGNEDMLFTITLKDNHAYKVHIGKIGVGKPEPMADTYAYSVNLPPQTGYTYYLPIGRYNSVPSNIAAPI